MVGVCRPVIKAYNTWKILPAKKIDGKKMPAVFINGELTQGENLADLGAVIIAYEALQRRLNLDPSERKLIDGFTPEQRFFISVAQAERGKIKEGLARNFAATDPHSPSNARGTLPVINHPAFHEAFPPMTEEDKKKAAQPKIGVW